VADPTKPAPGQAHESDVVEYYFHVEIDVTAEIDEARLRQLIGVEFAKLASAVKSRQP
jgi:hypothetical protein